MILPLKSIKGHIFIQIDDELWFIDTGSPRSFGVSGSLAIGDERFTLDTSYCNLNNLTAEALSQFIGVSCFGLLGMDILGCFDLIFDVSDDTLAISTGEIKCDGQNVPIEHFSSIPIFAVQINGNDHRMIFDTGAQISFFQHELRTEFPSAGDFIDFHPTIGDFQTDTRHVPIMLGGTELVIRCGVLTDPQLCATLTAAGVQGIVGNEILNGCLIGYFPRRRVIMIQDNRIKQGDLAMKDIFDFGDDDNVKAVIKKAAESFGVPVLQFYATMQGYSKLKNAVLIYDVSFYEDAVKRINSLTCEETVMFERARLRGLVFGESGISTEYMGIYGNIWMICITDRG